MSENRALRAQKLRARRDASRSSSISESRNGRPTRANDNSVVHLNRVNDCSSSPIVRIDWRNGDSRVTELTPNDDTQAPGSVVGHRQSNLVRSPFYDITNMIDIGNTIHPSQSNSTPHMSCVTQRQSQQGNHPSTLERGESSTTHGGNRKRRRFTTGDCLDERTIQIINVDGSAVHGKFTSSKM